MENRTKRVIVYIDGFNFYYGLRAKDWQQYYWLDMVKFAEGLLRPHQELVEVCYFSLKATDSQKTKRQDVFFQANRLNPKFKLHLGKYLKKNITCRYCTRINHSFEEKETDVRIATAILADFYHERCDVSLIISADSDLVPAIERIRDVSSRHKIIVCFPPERHSSNLRQWANGVRVLTNKKLYEKSMLPETVRLSDDFSLMRPDKWK